MDKRYEKLCLMLLKTLIAIDCKLNVSLTEMLPLIMEAEADLCIHLRVSRPLAEEYEHKIVELAKVRILKLKASDVKSSSYTEGGVSKSETYLTAADFETQEKAVFDALSAHRRCRIVKARNT